MAETKIDLFSYVVRQEEDIDEDVECWAVELKVNCKVYATWIVPSKERADKIGRDWIKGITPFGDRWEPMYAVGFPFECVDFSS